MHCLHNCRVILRLMMATVVAVVAAPTGAELPRLEAPTTKLEWPLTLRWQSVSLRAAVGRLSESQRVSVWLDRRIDPSVSVDLAASDESLDQVLGSLSGSVGADWTSVGEVIYIGPPVAVGEFRTLLALGQQELQTLPPAARRKLKSRATLEIAKLTEPRQLVEQLARQAGFHIENSQAVPHDVWPDAKLPSTSVADQLAIVLLGFDLRWRTSDDPTKLRLEPLDSPLLVREVYPRSRVENSPVELEPGVVEAGPSPSQVLVAARFEQHERLAGRSISAARQPASTDRPTHQVYSLQVAEQPVGRIVAQLAAQLGKRLEVDPRLVDQPQLETRVTFRVEEADLEALLQAACEPAGIQAKLSGDTIQLQPVSGD